MESNRTALSRPLTATDLRIFPKASEGVHDCVQKGTRGGKNRKYIKFNQRDTVFVEEMM